MLSLLIVCLMLLCSVSFLFFFFNDTSTTEIYTLSLHDALPIWDADGREYLDFAGGIACQNLGHNPEAVVRDRKSTRLNSSHRCISYAVFCLKKKKKKKTKKLNTNKRISTTNETPTCRPDKRILT